MRAEISALGWGQELGGAATRLQPPCERGGREHFGRSGRTVPAVEQNDLGGNAKTVTENKSAQACGVKQLELLGTSQRQQEDTSWPQFSSWAVLGASTMCEVGLPIPHLPAGS